jgi:hypothetical protein
VNDILLVLNRTGIDCGELAEVFSNIWDRDIRRWAVKNQCHATVNVSCDHRFVDVAHSLERDIGAERVLVNVPQACFVI